MAAISTNARAIHPPKRALIASLGAAFSLLLTVALWVALAPPSVGGHTSVIVVRGNSMEPGMFTGDIVFVSNTQRATVGDVAAYHNPDLGVVIHRVIADDGARLTFQGDNRTTTDPYRPTYDEVVGTMAWRIPQGLRVVQFLSSPSVMLVLTLLPLAGKLRSSARSRGAGRRPVDANAMPRVAGLETLSVWHPVGAQVAGTAVVVLLGALGLFLLVQRTGATAPTTTTVPFAEQGTLNYTGDVPSGLYQDNRLAAPQPIVRGGTHFLRIDWGYGLVPADGGPAPAAVAGTYTLTAVLRHETGWERAIVLRPETRFTGAQFQADGTINMADIDGLAAQVENVLGIRDGLTTYTLRVIGRVNATGTVEGQGFTRDTTQTLEFVMNNRVLQLDPTVKKTTLHLDERGTVTVPAEVDRHLTVPMTGWSVRYADVPLIAAVSAALAAATLLLVALATLSMRHGGEAARIRAHYGQVIVDVAADSIDHDPGTIDVPGACI